MFKMEKNRLIENINVELSRLFNISYTVKFNIAYSESIYISYININNAINIPIPLNLKFLNNENMSETDCVEVCIYDDDINDFEDIMIKIKGELLECCVRHQKYVNNKEEG